MNMIASTNRERILPFTSRVNDFENFFVITEKIDMVLEEVVRNKPEILLLDYDSSQSNSSNGLAKLRKLFVEVKTIVLSDVISEDEEWNLIKAGARGCCRKDIETDLLLKVVFAVRQGELWIRRSLTCRLIDEFGKTTSKNKAYRTTLGLLNNLTQLEYDIAVRVGNGECNKQVAESCRITERTVKAHLTEIYNKLRVTDRLNLALVISADNRSALPNIDRMANGDSTEYLRLV